MNEYTYTTKHGRPVIITDLENGFFRVLYLAKEGESKPVWRDRKAIPKRTLDDLRRMEGWVATE